MRLRRKVENSEEHSQRLMREAQTKKDQNTANDAAIDQKIRQNIDRYGP